MMYFVLCITYLHILGFNRLSNEHPVGPFFFRFVCYIYKVLAVLAVK